jgi:hypothetical protein
MKSQAETAKTRITELEQQHKSLLWEKYNLENLNFDVMMARYPLIADEISAELDADEFFIDTGVVEAPKVCMNGSHILLVILCWICNCTVILCYIQFNFSCV